MTKLTRIKAENPPWPQYLTLTVIRCLVASVFISGNIQIYFFLGNSLLQELHPCVICRRCAWVRSDKSTHVICLSDCQKPSPRISTCRSIFVNLLMGFSGISFFFLIWAVSAFKAFISLHTSVCQHMGLLLILVFCPSYVHPTSFFFFFCSSILYAGKGDRPEFIPSRTAVRIYSLSARYISTTCSAKRSQLLLIVSWFITCRLFLITSFFLNTRIRCCKAYRGWIKSQMKICTQSFK